MSAVINLVLVELGLNRIYTEAFAQKKVRATYHVASARLVVLIDNEDKEGQRNHRKLRTRLPSHIYGGVCIGTSASK